MVEWPPRLTGLRSKGISMGINIETNDFAFEVMVGFLILVQNAWWLK